MTETMLSSADLFMPVP